MKKFLLSVLIILPLALTAQSFEFNTDGDPEGFEVFRDATFEVASGIGTVELTGTPPRNNSGIVNPNVSFDTSTNTVLRVKLKNNSLNDELRFIPTVDGNQVFTKMPMTPKPMTPDSPVFEVITFDLSNNTGWFDPNDMSRSNVVTELDFRFRNTANGNAVESGDIEIDYIIFNNAQFLYTNGEWLPADPADPTIGSGAADNIEVNGTVTLSGNIICNDIVIGINGELNIGNNQLNAKGSITNNGTLDGTDGTFRISGNTAQTVSGNKIATNNLFIKNVAGVVVEADVDLLGVLTLDEGELDVQNSDFTFKSSEGTGAILDEVNTGSIVGAVTVEQFFPASTGRAYRFVSAPVNFDGSITDNWQQGRLNQGDPGFEPNVDTQITGGLESEGYDQSVTNAPSLFTFDSSYTVAADAWQAVSSDNGDDLTLISPQAGDAYRIFIRGDRRNDLTTNSSTANADTKLTATGELVTGTFPDPASPAISLAGVDKFALVGNPYQAKISVQELLGDTENTNIVRDEFWQWDPTIQQYVLFNFTGGTTPMGSSLDGDVLPGQSFFVTSDNTGNGSLRFKEVYKVDSGKNNVNTKNTAVNSQLTINLSTQEQLAAGKANDVAVARFDDQFSNDFNVEDTAKFFANTHSLAWENDGEFYIVNRTSQPQDGDKFNLNVFVGETADYGFTIDVPALDNINAFFYDNLDESYTALPSSESTLVMKNIDVSDDESAAADRFQVVFSKSTLGVDDESAFAKAISLYPNPVTNSNISIKGLPASNDIDLSLYNISGQLLFERTSQNSSSLQNLQLPNLSAGVYVINITSGDNKANLKLIIQ